MTSATNSLTKEHSFFSVSMKRKSR